MSSDMSSYIDLIFNFLGLVSAWTGHTFIYPVRTKLFQCYSSNSNLYICDSFRVLKSLTDRQLKAMVTCQGIDQKIAQVSLDSANFYKPFQTTTQKFYISAAANMKINSIF